MKDLAKEIGSIKRLFAQALDTAKTPHELEKIRINFLGRQGSIASLIAQLKNLSVEEKRTVGPLLNELKTFAQQAYEKKEQKLKHANIKQKQLQQKHFDVTTSKYNELRGTQHIYTQVIEELENIFISMGYDIADGPEVETDYYNFGAVNIPADHPARDAHDTFWIEQNNMLLRTHTSSIQARIMEKKKPPIAVFSPGRVYRSEATDASHDFLFTQAECLLIDKNISISHLLATARTFLQAIFEKKDLQIRVRPGFFPFVEPGLEIDGSCPFCTDGCSVCKHTTWIELLGSGLVHPNVLKSGGIDPDIYSGFAFGLGIERIAMIKYGINDIRLFHSSKISFLDQF